jgi:hypothetical protein
LRLIVTPPPSPGERPSVGINIDLQLFIIRQQVQKQLHKMVRSVASRAGVSLYGRRAQLISIDKHLMMSNPFLAVSNEIAAL